MPSLATNSANVVSVTVRNTAGALVDPDTIELVWRLGRYGTVTTVAQSDMSNPSTGVYTATITPQETDASTGWWGGWWGRTMGVVKGAPILLFYEFRMTNPTYVERGKVALSTSEFAQ